MPFDLLPWLGHIKFNIMPARLNEVRSGVSSSAERYIHNIGSPKVINYVKSGRIGNGNGNVSTRMSCWLGWEAEGRILCAPLPRIAGAT